MQNIALQDEFFHGHISLEQNENGIRPWRLPHHDLVLHFPNLVDRAGCPAGVRLSCNSNTSAISLHCAAAENDRSFDCYVDGALHAVGTIPANETNLQFNGLSTNEKLIEIWLPHTSPVTVSGLSIDDGASCSAYTDKRLRWLTYGSSITQCGEAHSPSRTWPGTAARQRDLNLTCMGFGGNCHLESGVACCIRDQEFDLVTLKLGINVYGNGSLNPRSYFPAVTGLVRIIRERHPQTPIGVITSIYSTNREDEQNATGMTLKDYREQTREAVRRLREHGDERLELFEGLDMFGPEHIDMLPDHLHPNGDGYEVLGTNISEKVLKPMLAKYFP